MPDNTDAGRCLASLNWHPNAMIATGFCVYPKDHTGPHSWSSVTDNSSLLIEAFANVVGEQVRRWREAFRESNDERVELLAQDAIRELEALQDALLVGHFHDAIGLTEANRA